MGLYLQSNSKDWCYQYRTPTEIACIHVSEPAELSLLIKQDASFRRAPSSPDRASPARDGQAAQRIDHDGLVKSICVSLEKKIAEATKEQHTAQLVRTCLHSQCLSI